MRITLGLALLLASGPALGQQPDGAAVDAVFEKLAGADTPGCAVGVSRGGTTLLTRAYGSAELEHRVPITADTIFEAGSVSKQFTAAAVLLLAADGKLALGDDIRKYVPELPDYGATITIDHLLSHTSGLRDWGAIMGIAGWPRGTRAYDMADVLTIIARQRALNHAPGTEYSYTNSGYNLLAIIVKRVSGSSLAEFSRARLFDPLGMDSTSWRDDFRRIVPGRAVAYMRRGEDGWVQAMPFEDAYGNGGLLTTVEDLLTWNEALASGRLGALTTRRLGEQAVLTDGKRIAYARGLSVQEHRGQPEVSHGGATGGYRAWLGRFPQSKLSVALLCNAATANSTMLAHKVADQFLPAEDEPADARAVSAAAPPPLDEGLAGLFVNETDGLPLQLKIEEGKLGSPGRPPLDPLGPGRFRSGQAELRFEGRDRFRVTLPGGVEWAYRRVEPFAPTADELAAFAGRYESDEAGAAYLVTAEDGKLVLRLEDRPQIALRAAPAYRDAFEADGGIVRFQRDAAGGVSGFSVGISRVRELPFVRTGPAPDPRQAVSSASRR